MVRLVAKKRLSYAHRAIAAGEEFEAREAHVRILKALGADDAPPPPPPPPPAKSKAPPEDDLSTDPEPGLSEGDEEPKRRTYRRRDMRAED